MMSSYFRCNIKDFYEEVNFDQKTEKEKKICINISKHTRRREERNEVSVVSKGIKNLELIA